MTADIGPTDSPMRQASAALARISVRLVLTLLTAELVTAAIGADWIGVPLAALACGLLLLVPVVNVVSELVDEIAKRDWAFAGAASVVLALIVFSVLSRLG